MTRPLGGSTQRSELSSEVCLALSAGQRAVLGRDPDTAKNGGLPPLFTTFSITLLNSNSTLTLAGASGEVLDIVAWEQVTAGIARAVSPEAESPEQNDAPESWTDCAALYGLGDRGTPGQDNATCAGEAL